MKLIGFRMKYRWRQIYLPNIKSVSSYRDARINAIVPDVLLYGNKDRPFTGLMSFLLQTL